MSERTYGGKTAVELLVLCGAATSVPLMAQKMLNGRSFYVYNPDGDAELGNWLVARVQQKSDADLFAVCRNVIRDMLAHIAELKSSEQGFQFLRGKLEEAETSRQEWQARVAELEKQVEFLTGQQRMAKEMIESLRASELRFGKDAAEAHLELRRLGAGGKFSISKELLERSPRPLFEVVPSEAVPEGCVMLVSPSGGRALFDFKSGVIVALNPSE